MSNATREIAHCKSTDLSLDVTREAEKAQPIIFKGVAADGLQGKGSTEIRGVRGKFRFLEVPGAKHQFTGFDRGGYRRIRLIALKSAGIWCQIGGFACVCTGINQPKRVALARG